MPGVSLNNLSDPFTAAPAADPGVAEVVDPAPKAAPDLAASEEAPQRAKDNAHAPSLPKNKRQSK